jgi:hypothetical protein
MSRKKKTSKVIENANVRLASIKSIGENLDLGNGVTAVGYENLIKEVKNLLEDYNTTLSTVDTKANLYQAKEKDLRDLHERILISVAAKYGKNSDEYEQAGGVKKSERKKRTIK